MSHNLDFPVLNRIHIRPLLRIHLSYVEVESSTLEVVVPRRPPVLSQHLAPKLDVIFITQDRFKSKSADSLQCLCLVH